MNLSQLANLLGKLPAELIHLIGQIVRAISKSDNPKAAAMRALEEAGRKRALDEAIRRTRKK